MICHKNLDKSDRKMCQHYIMMSWHTGGINNFRLQ